MGFVIAAVAVLVVSVLFLLAAAVSVATSAGDQFTWGWRVFRKLGIVKLLNASHARAVRRNDAAARRRVAERDEAARNKN